MNTWTPLWSKVVDSSIWMEDKNTRILFITMLALKDRDHVVRYSAFELARKANLTEMEVIESLKVLQSPDTKRIEKQEFDGKRIEKAEDGWLMLNGEKYRKAMQELYRKEYKRTKQAEYRAKPPEDAPSTPPPKSTTPPPIADTEIPDSLKSSPEFVEWWGKWLLYLVAKKKKATYHTQDLQLRKLEELGPEQSIHWLKNAIEKGWQSFHDPGDSQRGKSSTTKYGPTKPLAGSTPNNGF